DIGDRIADSIIEYFSKEKNIEIVNRLKSYGLKFSEERAEQVSNILEGKSIVISGVFKLHSRDEYKQLIEQYGGKNTSSISSKTHYVLAGENMGPAKLDRATKLGIKIISEEEFLEMIG
ncbi:MAG: NAD-dependent DNA ligase LigA, partial [Bacteroidales bacterium]|nr:NAD-dependent DNA ligase LigA [Bacteroidales bacterium]